jgi:hypothetical protein
MPGSYIDRVEDHGTIWSVYLCLWDEERNGERNVCVYFDHRPFAEFYSGATRRDFYKDYAFGHGRDLVYRNIAGKIVEIEGPFENPHGIVPLPDPEDGDDLMPGSIAE